MSFPIKNATCDIYHGTNLPPSPPNVAGVSCYLEERFRNIKPQTGNPTIIYDHILRVDEDVDIRDGYNGAAGPSAVYIPDKTGTRYLVEAVARVGMGTSADHKIAYLQRQQITWPSNDV